MDGYATLVRTAADCRMDRLCLDGSLSRSADACWTGATIRKTRGEHRVISSH